MIVPLSKYDLKRLFERNLSYCAIKYSMSYFYLAFYCYENVIFCKRVFKSPNIELLISITEYRITYFD